MKLFLIQGGCDKIIWGIFSSKEKAKQFLVKFKQKYPKDKWLQEELNDIEIMDIQMDDFSTIEKWKNK